MLFRTLVSASLLASAASADSLLQTDSLLKSSVRVCGTPEPSKDHIAFTAKLAASEASSRKSGTSSRLAIAVDTYFHVISASQSGLDAVTDATLSEQLDVMNSDYGPSGISFNLIETTRTVNAQWARDGDELGMKQALRQGGYDTLNVYFSEDLGGGTLGYCYFPDDVSPGTTEFTLDGCSVIIDSLPGGAATDFDLGKTATHEVGHWFGLYHTFQGGCTGNGDFVDDTPAQASPSSGCTGNGDFVDDTPAQASPSSGCPVGRDSCPNQPGLDPITNYMDYSIDSCFTEFSEGQAERMASYWSTYRA